MLKLTHVSSAVLSAATLIASIPQLALAQPLFESVYPVIPSSKVSVPICYMQNGAGKTLDLSSLCGVISSGSRIVGNSAAGGSSGYSSASSDYSGSSAGASSYAGASGSGGSYAGASSYSGNCLTPDDRAADGSRCGARAASVRPASINGKLPGTGETIHFEVIRPN